MTAVLLGPFDASSKVALLASGATAIPTDKPLTSWVVGDKLFILHT